MADGATYPARIIHSDGTVVSDGSIVYDSAANQPQPQSNPVTSGALSTFTVVSGTGHANPATYQVTAYGVFTADATNNVSSCTIALSPDNTTYSNIQVISLAAAVNNTGAIALPVDVTIPAGWFVKFTAVHGTVGTLTYA